MSVAANFTPTYESAIARDPWVLVAPYVRSRNSLRSSALVCRAWNDIFMSLLWGDPTAYTNDDSLAYFLRKLPFIRLSTRKLVRTLRLSWKDPSIVDCFDAWLRTLLLLLLPNLQSLYASGLACLDHKALASLSPFRRNDEDDGKGEDKIESCLRLLEAHNAENLTSPALCQVIPSFPRLVYLDLSGSSPSRNHAFLAELSQLRDLKLLKLRGVGLKDADIEVLSHAIRRRVRFLDISINKLTDHGLYFLEKHCFKDSENPHPAFHETNDQHFEWSASGSPFANVLTSHSLVSARFEKHLRHQLSEPLTGRSNFGDIPWTGISHIVLGGNSISPESLGRLVTSKDLCYLDAGSSSLPPNLLKHPGAKSLRFLRVHHSAVTPNGETRAQDGLHSITGNATQCPSIRSLLDKRPLLDESGIGPALLHPSWVPSLETLVLTDVPTKVRQPSALADELIRYITACGDESHLAMITRSIYPQKGMTSLPHTPFALRRIVLETKPHSTTVKVSATEDEDSENLWKEASVDFSFFSNEAVARDRRVQEVVPEVMVDTVAKLAAFRRAKREEFSRQASKGEGCPYVEGYWKGEMTVVHG